MTRAYDAAVVGGGLAGMATAYHLVRADQRHHGLRHHTLHLAGLIPRGKED